MEFGIVFAYIFLQHGEGSLLFRCLAGGDGVNKNEGTRTNPKEDKGGTAGVILGLQL